MDQPSLFDEPIIEPVKVELPDFDRLPTLFQMIEGELRIADDRLATWASYLRVDLWITRNWHDLSDLGKLVQVVQATGYRGSRRVTTYLNLKQTRYFLNHSRLPHLKPYRTRVMIILDEYEAGNLVSTNAETTIRLQDATEAAEEAAPGSTQLGALVDRMGRIESDFTDVRRVATEAQTSSWQAQKDAQRALAKAEGRRIPPEPEGPTTSGLPRLADPREE